MDALASVPEVFAGGDDDLDDRPSNMKMGVKEMEMKAQIKSTLHGANQYRYTEPPKIELNLFAGKKR